MVATDAYLSEPPAVRPADLFDARLAAGPLAECEGWALYESDEHSDDDSRKSTWWAVRGADVRLLDWTPYRQPTPAAFRALVRLGFPRREHLAMNGPLDDGAIIAAMFSPGGAGEAGDDFEAVVQSLRLLVGRYSADGHLGCARTHLAQALSVIASRPRVAA